MADGFVSAEMAAQLQQSPSLQLNSRPRKRALFGAKVSIQGCATPALAPCLLQPVAPFLYPFAVLLQSFSPYPFNPVTVALACDWE
jgi:hypothetical protein